MRAITAAAFLALVLAGGCYIVTPFPGGYAVWDVPTTSARVSTGVTVSWSLIPGTAIYYSSAMPDVLYYGRNYYYVVNGIWYVSSRYNGPWRVVRAVPDAFLYIPHSHPYFRIVPWHPKYHAVYSKPPVKHYAPASPPSATPAAPYKGKPGKQEQEETPPPAAPPVFHRR